MVKNSNQQYLLLVHNCSLQMSQYTSSIKCLFNPPVNFKLEGLKQDII